MASRNGILKKCGPNQRVEIARKTRRRKRKKNELVIRL